MFKIQQSYQEARNNIEEIQSEEKGTIMNGIWYYIVSNQTRQGLSKKIREHLELPV